VGPVAPAFCFVVSIQKRLDQLVRHAAMVSADDNAAATLEQARAASANTIMRRETKNLLMSKWSRVDMEKWYTVFAPESSICAFTLFSRLWNGRSYG
jgi:hypothetical protein